jgi:hypothetical protein
MALQRLGKHDDQPFILRDFYRDQLNNVRRRLEALRLQKEQAQDQETIRTIERQIGMVEVVATQMESKLALVESAAMQSPEAPGPRSSCLNLS